DQRPSAAAAVAQAGETAVERTLAEARRTDQQHREQCVDDEDAAREGSPTLRRREESVRDRLRDDDCDGDAERVPRTGVTPDAAVEAEGNEGRVAREEDRRQRDRREVPKEGRAGVADHEEVGG